jgi:hypothetical protein
LFDQAGSSESLLGFLGFLSEQRWLPRRESAVLGFAAMPRPGIDAKPKTMTLEEWADLDEDVDGELVDGVLQEEETPSFLHEIIVTWLIAALHG